MSWSLSLACIALASAASLRGAPAERATPKSPPEGLVVDSVEGAWMADGIRAGDLLLGWERSPHTPANPRAARGTFSSPLETETVRIEESERGKLTFIGLRDGKRLSFEIVQVGEGLYEVVHNSLQLEVRPPLEKQDLDRYLEGHRLIRAGELERGISRWRALALEWERKGPSSNGVWLWFRIGSTLMYCDQFDRAENALQTALAGATWLGADSLMKPIWCALARVIFHQHDRAGTMEMLDRIIRATSTYEPSVWTAKALDERGSLLSRDGRPDEGLRFLQKAVEASESAAPEGLSHWGALWSLSGCEIELGDLDNGEKHTRAALAIIEKRNRKDLTSANLIDLGNVLLYRGDLAGAEMRYRQTLAVALVSSPGTSREAFTYGSLGELALRRGDLSAAERYFRRAVALEENGIWASRYYFSSKYYGGSLRGLGKAAAARGDLATAETLFRRCLEMLEKQFPDSLELTGDLDGLGRLSLRRGDPAAATGYFARALAIREKIAPGGIDTATSLNGLGDASVAAGNLKRAHRYFDKSLSLLQVLAPDSLSCAETLHDLGKLYRRRSRPEEAAPYFRRAVDVLEAQKQKLGGTEEVRTLFAASHDDYYRDEIEVLIELGKKEDAFRTLERSRARALLAMLAERDLVFAGDVPADLERESKLTDAAYDKVQAELKDLSAKDKGRQEDVVTRLRELRQKQEQIAERLKKASPRYGALHYPQPLDLSATQSTLDPGTLLLSYSVGEEKTHLFAVHADSQRGPPLSVYTIPVGEKALRGSVKAFRKLIEWAEPSPELSTRARTLYDTLLKPAEALIARSDRLLILPDGPLHTLPWAALARSTKAGRPEYLVAWKPIHTALSATIHAELKKQRRPPSVPVIHVAAFGDPKYPKTPEARPAVKRGESETADDGIEPEGIGDAQVRSVLRGGFRFDPLPATRQEVERIVGLYAPRAVAYLGEDATEEKAKSIGKDVPFIHFACHAVVNERFPLDSALVFTIPEHPREGQDNGLLQAWEIFEKMRIDADLVTLSACESGLGKEMGGEGLIGLTRAFQYAGARSVLASLWKVEDKATGELMRRFYTYLKAGKSKDEALRAAQIDLIRSADFSRPIDWASFQLNGDWR